MNEIPSMLNAKGKKFAIIAAHFNEWVVESLIKGSHTALLQHGVEDCDITLIRVPGAFELPLAAKVSAESGKYHAIITLAVIIRGETPHFDYVAAQAASGILHAGLSERVPVMFGVLTTESLEQAMNRAGAKSGNKGWDAAVGAIEMVNLLSALS